MHILVRKTHYTILFVLRKENCSFPRTAKT